MSKQKVRGNGTGTAFKRGQTWTAMVTIGWTQPSDPSQPKKPIRRTKGGFHRRVDALNYCPILLAGGVEKRKEPPRLSEYWKVYSEGKMLQLSSSKISAYKTAWKKLSSIKDVRVDALSVDLLQKTIDENCPTFNPAKDCRSLLSNLFELAAAEQYVSKDLPSFITLPRHEERERQTFTKEEQARIWKVYDDGDIRAAIPILMLMTGLMPGETQKLKVSNIDLENRQIRGAGMKTKVRKATPVVVADVLVPVLQALIDHAMPSGYLWKQDEKQWYENYYAALEKAECRRLEPYCCRHTTASLLAVDENIAPATVRKIMRWSTAKMLDR